MSDVSWYGIVVKKLKSKDQVRVEGKDVILTYNTWADAMDAGKAMYESIPSSAQRVTTPRDDTLVKKCRTCGAEVGSPFNCIGNCSFVWVQVDRK